MRKILIPSLAIAAMVIASGCEQRKKEMMEEAPIVKTDTSYTEEIYTEPVDSEVNDSEEVITTETEDDEVSTKAAATRRGAAVGAGASSVHRERDGERAATQEPEVTESDFSYDEMEDYDDSLMGESEYPEIDRQSMEEYPERETWGSREFDDSKLDRIQEEEAIFYGYPGATGASGAPGSGYIDK